VVSDGLKPVPSRNCKREPTLSVLGTASRSPVIDAPIGHTDTNRLSAYSAGIDRFGRELHVAH